MSDTIPPPSPQLKVLVQYIKDFSFENPNAPQSLAPQGSPPEIAVQVNINARQLADTDFEVSMLLEGEAAEGETRLFRFELSYAGVFRLENIPEAEAHPVIMIECPRLLFPFARQLIADAVRSSGFPPLFLDPIDFNALYRQRMTEVQAEQKPAVLS